MRNRQPDNTFVRWIQSRHTQTHLSDERGQAIVVIALALIGLIAFAGLVFDGGTAYAERRRMKNSAEAGAIAGAYKLAFTDRVRDQDIWDAINDYSINRNGQQRYGGQVTRFMACYYVSNTLPCVGDVGGSMGLGGGVIPPDAIGVWVTATTTFNTFFMNVLGIPVGTVSAGAKAIFGPVNNINNNVWPIAPYCDPTLVDCGYVPCPPGATPPACQVYDLWGGDIGPGNFGWLSWGNTTTCNGGGVSGGDQSVKLLCSNLESPQTMQYTNPNDPLGLDHTLSKTDYVGGDVGVSNGSKINYALKALVDGKTAITVPIWNTTNGQGGAGLRYQIYGFATFVLIGYNLPQGSGTSYGDTSGCLLHGGDCIRGYFLTMAKTNSNGDLCYDSCSIPDTGTRTVGLIGP